MKTKQEIQKEGYEISFTNGSGKGGQKRNRTYSCAVVRHILTGIVQRCDDTRLAQKNMNLAYQVIQDQLSDAGLASQLKKLNDLRQTAMNRGVIRTYNYKRGTVKNHRSGTEFQLSSVLDGQLDDVIADELLNVQSVPE